MNISLSSLYQLLFLLSFGYMSAELRDGSARKKERHSEVGQNQSVVSPTRAAVPGTEEGLYFLLLEKW